MRKVEHKEEPPDGTFVRLLEDTHYGWPAGSVGQIKTDHENQITSKIVMMTPPTRGNQTCCWVHPGKYEVMETRRLDNVGAFSKGV
jgi:hypothetical protein